MRLQTQPRFSAHSTWSLATPSTALTPAQPHPFAAAQKEDGQHNPLPSEFMALEASVDASGAGSFRVAQRVGSTWGTVQGKKGFSC